MGLCSASRIERIVKQLQEKERGSKWRVITMWIMNLAFKEGDTRGRVDSYNVREMKCVHGLATTKLIGVAAWMIMKTSGACAREITGAPATPSTRCARVT